MEMEFEKETYDCFITPIEEQLMEVCFELEDSQMEVTFWQVVSVLQALLLLLLQMLHT